MGVESAGLPVIVTAEHQEEIRVPGRAYTTAAI